MSDYNTSDRNLAMEAVRATERAAIAAARHLGSGDEKAADLAAATAMHEALARLSIDATVRIGEGEGGATPLLYVGETLGVGEGPKADVALVALEGKSIVARGGYNALSVLAMSEDGGFLSVPDIYMDKIAIGAGYPEGIIDLDAEPADNLKALAEAKEIPVGQLTVCLLDRPRHSKLIEQIRQVGARIQLILDGDVSGVISAAYSQSDVDVYLGIGGAPQGILSAAAVRGIGGQMQTRLVIRGNEDADKAKAAGIADPDRKYTLNEMARGHVTFAATGVTQGSTLKGVQFGKTSVVTHSLVVRSLTRTFRFIEGHHDFSDDGAG